ncbi:glycosyltransferase family 87 protein [Gemmata obscuriglobus]|uniref:glycosyltransferase family 87 protein n=1 Tax=Gemmata obscuriglobus TaxID=114 RepID=UPI0013A5BB7D|nr:glycosyltransferase family 87 protein [Gemmata obscuriglobus]
MAARRGLALCVTGAVAACVWALASAATYRHVPSDLTQDYLTARALRDGTPVYDPLPAAWAHPGATDTVTSDHPPPYIVALAPLELLPYPIAFLLLAAANVAAGTGCVVIVGRELGWSARVTALVVTALLLHPGAVTCLCVGNVSLVLLLPIALGWRALRRDRAGPAGAWLGLAGAIKLYPGLLVLGLFGERTWRGIATAGVVVIVCWGAATVVTGSDSLVNYVQTRAPANARSFVGHGFNLSVAGAAHRAFGAPNEYSPWLERMADRPDVAARLSWAARGAVVLLLAVGLVRARHQPDRPDRTIAILIPAMLLLSPLTWLHAVPMMLVPIAVLGRHATGSRRTFLIACAAALWMNDRWLATQWVALTGENVPPALNLILLAPTWGMLGVLALATTCPRTRER